MKIHANEISALIKEQIKNYRHKIDSNDVGTVVSVGDGIANVYGLEKAMLGELLLFPNNVYGMVMNLDSDSVGVVLLGNDNLVKEGDLVNRTKMVMEVILKQIKEDQLKSSLLVLLKEKVLILH